MILKRDEFIKEVYEPMMEEKEYRELQAINEGLLKNLFGKLKTALGFAGWKSIKGDQEIIKIYKEFDDKLTGFTTMKLNKLEQCDKIRQELVNFADSWYELKMKEAKEKDKEPDVEKSMDFEDETLKGDLETCKKNIENIADGDNQMIKWSQLLTQNMTNVINKSISQNIKDEKKLKEIEELEKEEQIKSDEINKKMEKLQNDELNKIIKDRKTLIENSGSTALNNDILGDKAIQNICDEFKKIEDTEVRQNDGKDMIDILSKDKLMGFSNIYAPEDITDNIDKFINSMTLTKAFYGSLNDRNVMKKFEDTPGASVQAMCIAVGAFIKYCIYGGNDYGNFLPIMAKCAIVSNGIASYNLPLNGDENEPGNFFTDTINLILNGELGKGFLGKLKSDVKTKISKNDGLMDILGGKDNEFTQNAKTLLNKVKSEAKKEIEKAEKEHNDKVEKFKLNIEKKHNKKSEN